MIRYALACDQAHAFESWFPSSDAYDEQVARGLVSCPICGSSKVDKRLMAPALGRTEKATATPQASPALAPPAGPQPVALLSEPERQLRALLTAVREHVTKTADYVGGRFADEARKMHEGEIEHRPIYGEAAPHEAKALIEDGIEVYPLPIMPEERN